METQKLEIEVDDLLLDLDNPRIGTVASQPEALAAIVRLSARNFKTMMASIKAHGLDPGDSFYLVQEAEEGDGYTVVDGNRRLAALKVLNNPDLLQGTDLSDTMKRPLAKEAENYAPTGDTAVSCVLFENRQDAGEWIERRHGRDLEGEGRIFWGTLEIQRFQKDPTVLDVITFVEKNSTYSDADWHRIKASVEKNTSTLRRFLESKAGRQHLGFASGPPGERPQFTFSPGYEIEVLSQIFSDIDSGEVNTRTHNKASDIEEYFASLTGSLSSQGQRAGTAQAYATTLVRDSKARPRQVARAARADSVRTRRVSPPRLSLAPSRHPFAEPDTEKGKQLFREASRLRLRETPLACAYLFRAILEYSIDTEMRQSNLPYVENGTTLDLQTRLERVISHLNSSGRAQRGDLTAIRTTLTARNGSVSVGALNGYIHSRVQLPSAEDLRNAWDHAVPLFTAIFGSHP